MPVKIVMDDPPTDIALGPGMSVVPTARVDASQTLYEQLRRLYERRRDSDQLSRIRERADG